MEKITPEIWLAAYDHCKANSQYFTCEGCPLCTGRCNEYGLYDCEVSLCDLAYEIINNASHPA